MKLRNKKTGEVFNFVIKAETDPTESHFKLRTGSGGWEDGLVYGSLEELNEEWEDYEEPDTYYYISDLVNIESLTNDHGCILPEEIWGKGIKRRKEVGNYFETKEEAEKAIKKLKAWKRLKDKGFGFESWFGGSKDISFYIDECIDEDIAKDLDLLFGGE